MKWIKLRIYKGEDLVSELERVESKYDNLINEVRCSGINDKDSKVEFLSFREEIEQRIIELNQFYQLNINDSRISIFEKVKNRLLALLQININIEAENKIIQKLIEKLKKCLLIILIDLNQLKEKQFQEKVNYQWVVLR